MELGNLEGFWSALQLLQQKVKWWNGSGCMLIGISQKIPPRPLLFWFLDIVWVHFYCMFIGCHFNIHHMLFLSFRYFYVQNASARRVLQCFIPPIVPISIMRGGSLFRDSVIVERGSRNILFFCSLSLFLSYLNFFIIFDHISQAVTLLAS